MLQEAETEALCDVTPVRTYTPDELNRPGTSSGVGIQYVLSTNDAVIRNVFVARDREAQVIFGPCVSGETGVLWNIPEPSAWGRLFERLEELHCLEPDWNGYGSMPPNATALAYAREILHELHNLDQIPERVVASADDGVGIYVASGQKYAMIECYNDGGIVIGVSDREGNIRNWEITPESHIIRTGLREALAYLDG